MNKVYKLLGLLSVVLMLEGCASAPPNVPVAPEFWQNHQQKVAVATSTVAVPEYWQQGQEGLLDMAINSMVTSKFNNHLENYNASYLVDIRSSFASRLTAKQITANIYDNQIDLNGLMKFKGDKKLYAEKNFMPLKEKLNADRLLLVTFKHFGAERSYYGFIPLGDPKAFCQLKGQLIDLNDNRVLWRYAVSTVLPVQGEWDQPPQYAHFDASLHQAVNSAENELLENFFTA